MCCASDAVDAAVVSKCTKGAGVPLGHGGVVATETQNIEQPSKSVSRADSHAPTPCHPRKQHVEKSPSDKRDYLAMELPSGMKVR